MEACKGLTCFDCIVHYVSFFLFTAFTVGLGVGIPAFGDDGVPGVFGFQRLTRYRSKELGSDIGGIDRLIHWEYSNPGCLASERLEGCFFRP